MKNFETYRTEAELLRRVDQLKAMGVKGSDIEVISKNKVNGTNRLAYGDIDAKTSEASLGDKIAAFFSGEDAQVKALDKYNFSPDTRNQAMTAVNNGYYLLHLKSKDIYNKPSYYNDRFDYLDEDLKSSDNLTPEDKIRIHEERLRIDKDRVESGSIEINKEVVSERQEVKVPVEKERVIVERHKVDEKSSHDFDELGKNKDTIRVPIHEEKINVSKENVVTEELVIKKEKVVEDEIVSAEIRKEKVDVDENNAKRIK
ncbi:DUF2382 domain-containing protein [Peptostreptococcus equinus]|uniref:DUF2382 domain-containing protein n=1 Tax=Peptostreptococcus equinus TaxID=3003601 RepID=A0ABY7JUM3_9FIRM|nr:DUF2382 domain-containing protein [Peptostreptococcus sp. CBA3647]WAW15675.1 DUF2382 domain-containing protein [Peptostreptococcus sp. CBA3647]